MLDPITGESYVHILTKVSELLEVKLNIRKQNKTGRSYYIIEMSSVKSLEIITDYLNKYPLNSSKFLDYQDWIMVVKYVINKIEKNKVKVEEIKKKMNNCRTYFNWDHLDNLE
jgi:hypothetical protein